MQYRNKSDINLLTSESFDGCHSIDYTVTFKTSIGSPDISASFHKTLHSIFLFSSILNLSFCPRQRREQVSRKEG
ncbi:hypothetical protein AB6A40_011088 [Gnathostoma spinigerum]|uniref:Uncharacterized protein n=1 Tax=Gnathostoma spinigerum TaxID=75299 RepID=A0ABD6F2S7_9BILA